MHRRLALAALWAMLMLVPAASAHASNDDFAAAKPLPLGAEDATVDNTGFTVEQGEALTAPGGPRDRCDLGPGESTQSDRTAWWFVNGTGRPITVTAAGESFDTTLGIFPA